MPIIGTHNQYVQAEKLGPTQGEGEQFVPDLVCGIY